jgi:peptide deformylase
MQLPILSYGHDFLRKQCEEIDANYPDLNTLIDNMWETKGQVKAKYPMTFAK